MDRNINISFQGRLSQITDVAKLTIGYSNNLTIQELINKIVKSHPKSKNVLYNENGQINTKLIILVNGHSFKLLNGLNTSLNFDDLISIDRIDFLSPVGGG